MERYINSWTLIPFKFSLYFGIHKKEQKIAKKQRMTSCKYIWNTKPLTIFKLKFSTTKICAKTRAYFLFPVVYLITIRFNAKAITSIEISCVRKTGRNQDIVWMFQLFTFHSNFCMANKSNGIGYAWPRGNKFCCQNHFLLLCCSYSWLFTFVAVNNKSVREKKYLTKEYFEAIFFVRGVCEPPMCPISFASTNLNVDIFSLDRHLVSQLWWMNIEIALKF